MYKPACKEVVFFPPRLASNYTSTVQCLGIPSTGYQQWIYRPGGGMDRAWEFLPKDYQQEEVFSQKGFHDVVDDNESDKSAKINKDHDHHHVMNLFRIELSILNQLEKDFHCKIVHLDCMLFEDPSTQTDLLIYPCPPRKENSGSLSYPEKVEYVAISFPLQTHVIQYHRLFKRAQSLIKDIFLCNDGRVYIRTRKLLVRERDGGDHRDRNNYHYYNFIDVAPILDSSKNIISDPQISYIAPVEGRIGIFWCYSDTRRKQYNMLNEKEFVFHQDIKERSQHHQLYLKRLRHTSQNINKPYRPQFTKEPYRHHSIQFLHISLPLSRQAVQSETVDRWWMGFQQGSNRLYFGSLKHRNVVQRERLSGAIQTQRDVILRKLEADRKHQSENDDLTQEYAECSISQVFPHKDSIVYDPNCMFYNFLDGNGNGNGTNKRCDHPACVYSTPNIEHVAISPIQNVQQRISIAQPIPPDVLIPIVSNPQLNSHVWKQTQQEFVVCLYNGSIYRGEIIESYSNQGFPLQRLIRWTFKCKRIIEPQSKYEHVCNVTNHSGPKHEHEHEHEPKPVPFPGLELGLDFDLDLDTPIDDSFLFGYDIDAEIQSLQDSIGTKRQRDDLYSW